MSHPHVYMYLCTGSIDLDEFSVALQQVHGEARSIDIAKVAHDTRTLRKELCVISDMLTVIRKKTVVYL